MIKKHISLNNLNFIEKLITILLLVFFVFNLNPAAINARYVYDVEEENERNARQDPSYGQDWDNEFIEDRRNERQDPSYGQDWYNNSKEDRRNAKQDPSYGQDWYNKSKEDRRNAKQDPSYGQDWYDKKAEDRRNAKQKPSYGQPWYDKEAEDERNERQKPKKNDCDPRCSHGDYCTKYCPEPSEFIDRYLKDYSTVENHPPFTEIYVRDYSQNNYCKAIDYY